MGGTLQHCYWLLMHVLVPIPSDDYDVLEQNISRCLLRGVKIGRKLSEISFFYEILCCGEKLKK
jgi:hypothetical protein